VSVGEDNTARLWDVNRLWVPNTVCTKSKTVLHENPGYVTALAFSPDSKMPASGSESRVLRVWDIATAKVQESFITRDTRWIRAATFLSDGVAFASTGGTD